MFNCYTHGWTSRTYVCPVCHPTVSTTSTTVNLPFLYIEPDEKDAEIARLRAALEKISKKPKWYKDRGYECLSKHDLESVLMIAREALKK